jgi:uncharacterized protein DUF1572
MSQNPTNLHFAPRAVVWPISRAWKSGYTSMAMREILSSIEGEWRRCKVLADGALQQTKDDELGKSGPGGGNSIAVIVTHLAGNFKSRFTDFLTTDGEKAWRNRDSEFESQGNVTRRQLTDRWENGWAILFVALRPLTDQDLSSTVTIRGEKFLIHEALIRLLSHTSYHVGQIVYLAKAFRAAEWKYLTIPPGKSEEYNRNPTHEKAPRV